MGALPAFDGLGERSIEMNERNFFAELKRRNVYKVAIAYAVVAWLLIQAASIFFPAFDAPPWVMKIFIHRHHLRFSSGADFFLGLRDYAGRNQTRIRHRA